MICKSRASLLILGATIDCSIFISIVKYSQIHIEMAATNIKFTLSAGPDRSKVLNTIRVETLYHYYLIFIAKCLD